ncbi:hypothetical protein [Larkinella terrae]|uniref:Prolyl oligopeptidase family serine peptidase n=1 Tax=Larkinella terrae TaxID=2025311 RepID=A0A7K0ER54_9BACT|nr:hypothetical protein [Larkinella terrae]MRS64031.1 hypothetical protein [Larkinella terrae]
MSNTTTIRTSFYSLGWLPLVLLAFLSGFAQSRNPALDSMGANMGRQNWKAAIEWALKAGEANPEDKYWRYLNAADFASRDKNADLTFHYLNRVVDSDIFTKGPYSNKSFDWLRSDPRWAVFMAKVNEAKERERQHRVKTSLPYRQLQKQLLSKARNERATLAKIPTASELYQQLHQPHSPRPKPVQGRYQLVWLAFADSIEVPYFIQLPAQFDAQKDYPMVVVLHGAVAQQASFPDVADSTHTFFGQSFMNQASESGLITVFPYSTRRYNWMMPDDGFDIVPQVIREVKKMYNIDDSRVYVTGHSNGATGAFSYLMKQPGLFAGFSGINNRPQVRTGGTFFRNAQNRSFYNVATDYDYYFPFEGHRSLVDVAKKWQVDWQNIEVEGHRSHGYLIASKDSATRGIYRQLFADMLTRKRNPFQKQLYWECDNLRHNRCDWLEINTLDTLSAPAEWHQAVNFQVTGWRDVYSPATVKDSTSQAFVFPRKSGAVSATYSQNQFILKTSRAGSVTIYISPEMVDLSRPVKVIINNKTVFNARINMDKAFMLSEFDREADHQAVWVNRLTFNVK